MGNLLDGSCVELKPQDNPEHQSRQIMALESVVVTSKLWPVGAELDIHFFNGDEGQKSAFKARAIQWMDYANVVLKFDRPAAESEIRVQFGNSGNSSYVGNDNAGISKSSPTMRIQNMSSVQHEVGHALGCVHEHQSPEATIQWNKPVVYRALGGPPNNWSREKVDHNVLNPIDADITQYTAFDPKSVMLYFFPDSWTLDGQGTVDNEAISATDGAFLSRCYPGCTIDFSHPEIVTAGCPRTGVTTGVATDYNAQFGKSWVLHDPGNSFIEIVLDQAKKYGQDDIYTEAYLKVIHLTSMDGSDPGYSPVTISLNGNKIAENYSPPSGNYMEDHWKVTDHMADGENRIRIDFDCDATTNYWIQRLELDCHRAFR